MEYCKGVESLESETPSTHLSPSQINHSNNQLGVVIHDAGIQYLRRPGRTNDALNTIVVDEEATKIKAELPSTTATRAPSLSCSLEDN